MAVPLPLLLLLTLLSLTSLSLQQQISPAEQESLYLALESLNSTLPWRSLFPDDLCLSPPHGVVCDLFLDPSDAVLSYHVVELNFGPVSDFSPNPPCSPNASFPDSLLSGFPHLRKIFFYNCFTANPVSFPDFGHGSDLEELVFIDNPALFGTLNGSVGDFLSLRRLIVTGTSLAGLIPAEIGRLSLLEQLTLSRNNLEGEIPLKIGDLRSLRVFDLSGNRFEGSIPESIFGMNNLLKLDFSSNRLSGKIPETLKRLKNLEFLDLSNNNLGSYGVPPFLGEMPSLKELYLSGNQLGGPIPEIWENLGGILGIGLSGLGLVGNIPASMGSFLGNAVYIGLDNNRLDGSVPKEFGMLGRAHEINLENNRLSGRVPLPDGFISRLGGKLKLQGNPDLCVDNQLVLSSNSNNLKACTHPPYISISAHLFNAAAGASPSWSWLFLWVFGHFVWLRL